MFDTHMLNENGKLEVSLYKEKLAEAAKWCASLMPECREKSLFLTKMEEASFFGTKAIASKPTCHTEKTEY